VVLDGDFDAALLSFTHDVLRSPVALDTSSAMFGKVDGWRQPA
jgi:hypothetical protein